MSLVSVCALCGLHAMAAAATLTEEQFWPAAAVDGSLLRRLTGPREAALGGASAVSNGVSSVTSNPAALSGVTSPSGVFSHEFVAPGAGVSLVGFGSRAWNGGIAVVAALSQAKYLPIPDGTAGEQVATATSMESVLAIGWGFANPGWMQIAGRTGVGLEMLRGVSGSGPEVIAVNAGMLVSLLRQLQGGLTLSHAAIVGAAQATPAMLAAGLAWRTGNVTLTGHADLALAGAALAFAGGVEWAFVPTFRLRAGYRRDPLREGLGVLAGLRAGLGVRLGRVGLDYVVVPEGSLGMTHRIALLLGRNLP